MSYSTSILTPNPTKLHSRAPLNPQNPVAENESGDMGITSATQLQTEVGNDVAQLLKLQSLYGHKKRTQPIVPKKRYIPLSKADIATLTKRVEVFAFIVLPLFTIICLIVSHLVKDYMVSQTTVPVTLTYRAPIEKITWAPDMEVADQITAEERPLVLINTVVSSWKAIKQWNKDYLMDHIPMFSQAYQQDFPFLQIFTQDKPLTSFLKLVPTYQVVDIPSAFFFGDCGENFNFWSGGIGEFNLASDLPSYSYLAVGGTPTNANFQMFSNGTVSWLHYTFYHTFLAQVKGKTKITLIPPEFWRHIYLYPFHHPLYHYSQANITNPNFKKFTHFRSAQAHEVILREGELLYLPPLWFHQIEAMGDSIVLAVESESESSQAKAELEQINFIFLETWSLQETYDACKVLITMMIEQFYGPGKVSEVISPLVKTRFKILEPHPTEQISKKKFIRPGDQTFCGKDVDERAYRAILKKTLNQVKKALENLSKETMTVLLEDLIQQLVYKVTSIDKIPAYLHSCFLE